MSSDTENEGIIRFVTSPVPVRVNVSGELLVSTILLLLPINNTVFATAVSGDVGGVNVVVYKQVPLITR